MKKILISIIVLIVIFSATYFIQQNLLKKDTAPNTETNTPSATTTGEPIALSTQDMPKTGNLEFNVDYKQNVTIKPSTPCWGSTYTPKLTPQGGNTVGPFPYPVQFTFTGSVDDNLMINGKVVDGDKGIQSGSPCSHRHDLTYTELFKENTPIKIQLMDQHGGEVAIKGKISIKKIERPEEFVDATVNLKIENFDPIERANKIQLYYVDKDTSKDVKKVTLTNVGNNTLSGKIRVKKDAKVEILTSYNKRYFKQTSANPIDCPNTSFSNYKSYGESCTLNTKKDVNLNFNYKFGLNLQ